MITGLVLAAQVALSPCAIEGIRPPARCGTYRVWEDRNAKQGRQLDLSIIVLEAFAASKKPDPMFFLSGGPGDAPSFNARFFSRAFEGMRQTRDLVLVDLRGTGKSAALTCPELAKPDGTGTYDQDMMNAAAIRACRARLEQRADLIPSLQAGELHDRVLLPALLSRHAATIRARVRTYGSRSREKWSEVIVWMSTPAVVRVRQPQAGSSIRHIG